MNKLFVFATALVAALLPLVRIELVARGGEVRFSDRFPMLFA